MLTGLAGCSAEKLRGQGAEGVGTVTGAVAVPDGRFAQARELRARLGD